MLTFSHSDSLNVTTSKNKSQDFLIITEVDEVKLLNYSEPNYGVLGLGIPSSSDTNNLFKQLAPYISDQTITFQNK